MGNRITATASQLAEELKIVGHSNVAACLDISHAVLHCDNLGIDWRKEVPALIPFAKHVHVHDSFGRTHNIPTHTTQEDLGFGIGDLHLPVGWGSLPFDEIVTAKPFPKGAIFNIELDKHRWHALTETIAQTRRLSRLAKTAG